MPIRVWRGTATARAGVAGNPSDALGGAALAVPVPGLLAEVELRDAERVTVRHAAGAASWSSVGELVEQSTRLGHDGGDRLVTATIVTLHRHLATQGIEPDDSPFEAVWCTGIPRSVGLAGSSALVIATLRALASRWALDLEPPDVARLALDAEVAELGIAAGWMDRAVQAHGAPTLVDAREDPTASIPPMHVIDPGGALDLLAVWDPAGASPSGRLHRSLRARSDAGDPEVSTAVDGLVDAARAAAAAVRSADVDALGAAVARSCELRARLGALDTRTAELVEAVRSAGGVATSAGSGGAVLAVPLRVDAAELARRLGLVGLPAAAVPLRPSDPGPARREHH